MSTDIRNVYEDARRAEAYAKLEFPGTYYLAYRDLPQIIGAHVAGKRAVDFGCGTGRSTRFLKQMGFEVVGVDIAEDMIRKARELDPAGDYRLIRDGDVGGLEAGAYDLVLSAFSFDNIAGMDTKVMILKGLGNLLADGGSMVNLVSAPEIYLHEWASFSTKDFPENSRAKSGEKVRIIITATEDRRPVEDIVWSDQAYQETYKNAGLAVASTFKPLASGTEPCAWVNETRIAPWVIYVLKKNLAREARGSAWRRFSLILPSRRSGLSSNRWTYISRVAATWRGILASSTIETPGTAGLPIGRTFAGRVCWRSATAGG